MKRFVFAVLAWMLSAVAALAAVNVNTATKEQLDALKGIGPTKAQAIIDYRTKNGPFKSIDDLEKVPGIGPATLKEIRNDVTLTGASTGVSGSAKEAAPGKKGDKAAAKADEGKAAAKADDKKAAPKAEEKKATGKDEPKAAKKDAGKEAKKDDAKAVKDDGKATKDDKKADKK